VYNGELCRRVLMPDTRQSVCVAFICVQL